MQVFYFDDPETSLFSQLDAGFENINSVGATKAAATEHVPRSSYCQHQQRAPSSSSSSTTSFSTNSDSSSGSGSYSSEFDLSPASSAAQSPEFNPKTSARVVDVDVNFRQGLPKTDRQPHPLFAPWSSLTKILPKSSNNTSPVPSTPHSSHNEAINRNHSLSLELHTTSAPPTEQPTLKRSKPLPLPPTGSTTSSSAPPHPPAWSREAEEARRGRNRWPRLLWNSEVDAEALDILQAYHERAVGGSLPVLRVGDSKEAIADWSRRLEAAGL